MIYNRFLLWCCGFMGFLVLSVPNPIRWIGLILLPCSFFLDYHEWKEKRLKEVG
jgi:hypothetical protein